MFEHIARGTHEIERCRFNPEQTPAGIHDGGASLIEALACGQHAVHLAQLCDFVV
jgi:hypothetical protein